MKIIVYYMHQQHFLQSYSMKIFVFLSQLYLLQRRGFSRISRKYALEGSRKYCIDQLEIFQTPLENIFQRLQRSLFSRTDINGSGNEVLVSRKVSENNSKKKLGTFLFSVSGFQILMIATCLQRPYIWNEAILQHFVIRIRDAKGFFEDPEPRGSPADFHLRNPGVYILVIFAFFGGFLSTPGNPGVYSHY